MGENNLKKLRGKKIRRQYFNAPIIVLYLSMATILSTVFIFSLWRGKLDTLDLPSTAWTGVWVCFCFSLPFLILRTLNKHFFGKIICVLNEEGIYYPTGKLRWETVEKLEYAIDSKPRYKSDLTKGFRAIIYTRGGKHVVLTSAPMCMLSRAKKYNKELDVKITGAKNLLSYALFAAAIVFLCPLYVCLLVSAPGVSLAQWITATAIWFVLLLIRLPVFDAYAVKYRFWSRILPRKWLSYIILWCYYLSFFAAMIVISYFPNWAVVILVGVYLGVVSPPVPSRRGNINKRLLSYEQLCDIYINRADFWEKQIEKRQKKT